MGGYLLAALLLLAVIGTGSGYWFGERNGQLIEKGRTEAAQAKVQEKTDELKVEAENHVQDMYTAQQVGFEEGKKQARIVYAKGAQYAANDKGISNPVCVMGIDSLQFLNSARADVRTAAATPDTSGLLGPGDDPRSVVRGSVPAIVPGRSAVPGVPQQPPQLRGAGEVSGQRMPAHSKPTPIR